MSELKEKYNTVSTDDLEQDSDTFKILLATDVHLGYAEEDPIRGNDSFEAFEEVLILGTQEQVDFVLLGGDLFHENKPSRPTLLKCNSLIRKYCFGAREIPLYRLVGKDVEPEPFNYENKNLNISLPIFTIHGNHDDPTGPGNDSVLDILSVSGMVNYFGKSDQIDEIDVEPIVLRKGNSKLALFGLGAVRNERLYQTFAQNNVQFLQPQEDTFNLFIIHQNRVKHGEKSYIKPEFIPPFMDLVFWGHEHDNQIIPSTVTVGTKTIYITQPGSTVATSLMEGEAGEKNVGILYVREKEFKIDPRVLLSVRPFLTEDLFLDDKVSDHDNDMICQYISAKMDSLLDKVNQLFPENNKKPLLRIRVSLSRPYDKYKIKRDFLTRYSLQVANPEEVLLFSKQHKKRSKLSKEGASEDTMQTEFEDPYIAEDSLIDLFRDIAVNDDLHILTSEMLSQVLEEFVVKEEPRAMERYAISMIKNAKRIYMGQIESRPHFDCDNLEFRLIKQELDAIPDFSVDYTADFSDEYRSGEDTKDLIDLSQLSPTSQRASRTPVTSPCTRGSARVRMGARGRGMKRVLTSGKSRKRTRIDESLDGSTFSSTSKVPRTQRGGRKKQKI